MAFPSSLKEGAVAAGYLAGWKIVGKLPENFAKALFDFGADKASHDGTGMEMLRRNLSRVVGPENVTRELVKSSMRSYARYWREAFRLPRLAGDPRIIAQLADHLVGREHLEASLDSGRGVILALPHSGNWDMAGMWLNENYGQFTTVAERVKPEVLFQAFVNFRESLGFEVLPLTGGTRPPFERLKEVLADGGIVCLLGERDLTDRGVPVEFFGESTTMPAGPAKLAMETGAALHVVHCWFTEEDGKQGWGMSVSDSLEVTSLQETTQRIADGFATNIAMHPEDWHMLQPQWIVDKRSRKTKDKKG
ncbi:phosphatidylinositol mannoside acyltransferase [Corynebacterium breve]|uniref:Phosphatidylinositol mannoside acyltransferase n=1 Tax=Corynebacterium breve TaxID=3049799 RepID=A0ABY8VL58_9CORY|nr:phosphatidylinositol mannoside acyltransferase [Corynebacterium breve]WIM68958.1 phosphatidylinositol mannoside acyltransferase [Corynebacterium breve]